MNRTFALLAAIIGAGYPRFATLKERHQEAIMRMLFDWNNPQNGHWNHDGYAVMTKKYLRSIWSDDAKARSVMQGEYFIILYGDNHKGYARGYEPQAHMRDAFFKFQKTVLEEAKVLTDDEFDPVGKDKGTRGASLFEALSLLKIPTKLPAAPIRSRIDGKSLGGTKERKSGWTDVRVAPFVPINKEKLLDYVQDCQDKDYKAAAEKLLVFANNTICPGCIPVLYEQKKSGRIYEIEYAMQSTPRSVRQAALSGNWDYDIRNCHFAIFAKWAAMLDKKTPNVSEYLARKDEIQQVLADAANVSKEEIKSALLSLLYGAELRSTSSSWAQREYGVSSIQKTLGDAQSAVFVKLPFVIALTRELRAVGGAIIRSMSKSRGLVVNSFGGLMDPATSSNRQILCHGLQGVEAKALHAVVGKYGEDIILCMHDGWVSRKKLDVGELERVIQNATGFNLDVKESLIQYTGVPLIRPSLLLPDGTLYVDDWLKKEDLGESKIQTGDSDIVDNYYINQRVKKNSPESLPVQSVLLGVAPVISGATVKMAQYGEPRVPQGLRYLAVSNRPKWAQVVPNRIDGLLHV